MKNLNYFFLCTFLCAATLSANAHSGTSGGLTRIISDSILTIKGIGQMPHYTIDEEGNSSDAPWAVFKESVTDVVISEGVTSIGRCAFYSFKNMKTVSIPSTVIVINAGSFCFCTSLESLRIPDSVRGIGNRAFSLCTSLTSITIPASVTIFEYFAFEACYSLTSITNYAINPQKIDLTIFMNINKDNCTLFVPPHSIATYSSADEWNKFINIKAIPDVSAD